MITNPHWDQNQQNREQQNCVHFYGTFLYPDRVTDCKAVVNSSSYLLSKQTHPNMFSFVEQPFKNNVYIISSHDDVIKWKHFQRYWLFMRGIHRSPVNSPHNGQWRGALMLCLIYACINDWVNNREAGDLRRHRAHYDVIVMIRDMFIMPNKKTQQIRGIWQLRPT